MKQVVTTKAHPRLIPKVLLQAKEKAVIRASGKGSPWDRGHWANRK